MYKLVLENGKTLISLQYPLTSKAQRKAQDTTSSRVQMPYGFSGLLVSNRKSRCFFPSFHAGSLAPLAWLAGAGGPGAAVAALTGPSTTLILFAIVWSP